MHLRISILCALYSGLEYVTYQMITKFSHIDSNLRKSDQQSSLFELYLRSSYLCPSDRGIHHILLLVGQTVRSQDETCDLRMLLKMC